MIQIHHLCFFTSYCLSRWTLPRVFCKSQSPWISVCVSQWGNLYQTTSYTKGKTIWYNIVFYSRLPLSQNVVHDGVIGYTQNHQISSIKVHQFFLIFGGKHLSLYKNSYKYILYHGIETKCLWMSRQKFKGIYDGSLGCSVPDHPQSHAHSCLWRGDHGGLGRGREARETQEEHWAHV